MDAYLIIIKKNGNIDKNKSVSNKCYFIITAFFYKVFNQVLDEAPRPEPVLEGRKKDILGKEKGNR